MSGLTIGDYEIRERVGSGGVGDVFRATDLMLEREVAVKFLRPGLGAQPELVQRFRSEARTLAQLHHPNIATLYALHREGDTLAMIMELVDGKTVSALLREHGRLELDTALAIFLQALDGIGCAHESGVVHRDIKPSNLMLNRSGVLKVMDFGIARCVGTSRVTQVGNTVGTAQYMSPEQVQGRETDARSDIYALCLVLYEMLTDRLPFTSEVEYEVMRAHVEEQPEPPRIHVPDLPEAIEAAILRGMAKSPDDRFRSTRELRLALLEAVGGSIDVGPAELGALVARGGRSDAQRRPHPEHGETELLVQHAAATEAHVAELCDEVALTFSHARVNAPTTVWELPDTSPRRPVAQEENAPAEPPGPSEARAPGEPATRTHESPRGERPAPGASPAQRPGARLRRARTLAQAAALFVVAVSIGAPSLDRPALGAGLEATVATGLALATSPPSARARLERSAGQIAAPSGGPEPLRAIHLPVAWVEPNRLAEVLRPQVEPPAPARSTTEPVREDRSVSEAPRPPRPKPARNERKARRPRADDGRGARTFRPAQDPAEAPASGAGEWVLRR